MTEIGEGVFIPFNFFGGNEEEEKESVKVQVSVFFDGTNNNAENIKRRKKVEAFSWLPDIGKAVLISFLPESALGEETNIGIMERYVKDSDKYDHSFCLYVSGVGTTSIYDSSVGKALGKGLTGVPAKAGLAIVRVISGILSGVDFGKTIVTVDLNVFGFSRGAAAARCFIHKVLEKNVLCCALSAFYDIDECAVKVRCAGLYDTVASYGVDRSNDTEQLNLDSLKNGRVISVLQLAAADEYRDKFPLTNIVSAGGRGVQIFLPGAHADIGGGYLEEEDEDLVIFQEKEYAFGDVVDTEGFIEWCYDKGWYVNDIELCKSSDYNVGIFKYVEVIGKRRIYNSYSFIPLHIMADYARAQGVEIVGKLEDEQAIEGDLQAAYADLLPCWRSKTSNWHDKPWLKPLRHKYCHMSSRYLNVFNTENKVSAEGLFSAYEPRIVDGSWLREIING